MCIRDRGKTPINSGAPIVGAGGIGYELQSSFRMFEYQKVSAIIIIIFATIFENSFC